MKDQYVGDVNDFCKYALLRELSAATTSRLVVAWMRTAPDSSRDGRRISYLQRPERYRLADPELFDRLAGLLARGERAVAAVQSAEILPGARFQSELLEDDLTRRVEWFASLKAQVQPRDLMFFDPDNGLAVSSVPKGRRGACKYLYWDELSWALALDCPVCIYQHFPRRERMAYLGELSGRISALSEDIAVHAVFGSNVAFLLAATPQRLADLAAAADRVVTRLPDVLRRFSAAAAIGEPLLQPQRARQ